MTNLEDRGILAADRSAVLRSEDIRLEPCPRRVRTVFNGKTVADSTRVLYLFERDHLPVYYFPAEDVDESLLEPSDRSSTCPRKGHASYWSIRVGDRVSKDAVWGYPEPFDGAPDLSAYRAFYWKGVDHWYEEDEEVFVHPRDPYNRVDALRSSRHVRIEIDGVTVAESTRPVLLFETGLPTRHYLPRSDVRLDLLRPTDTETACPYKGRASYFTAEIDGTQHQDIAWSYVFPIPEIPKIEQLIAFYDEKVDVFVDGVRQERPQSAWS